MKVNRRRTVRVRIRSISFSLVALIGLTAVQICPAQSEREKDVAPRTLEVLDVGYILPVQIVAVRHLQDKHWMRDLEIEIRNVSAKPIYELYIHLPLPDDNNGTTDTFWGGRLQYGRRELMNPSHRARAEDKPIQPGETVIRRLKKE